jgi:hypothetical protein
MFDSRRDRQPRLVAHRNIGTGLAKSLYAGASSSSTLAVRLRSRPHRLGVLRIPAGILSCRCARATRKKSARRPTTLCAPNRAHRRRSDEPYGTRPPAENTRRLSHLLMSEQGDGALRRTRPGFCTQEKFAEFPFRGCMKSGSRRVFRYSSRYEKALPDGSIRCPMELYRASHALTQRMRTPQDPQSS